MKRNKKGFTIVELVIVIGVIGILSAILIPTFVSLTSKAQDAARKEECASAYNMYSAVALDKKIDKEEQKELYPEATYTADIVIEFAKQDAVRLVKDGDTGKGYVYSAADGWHDAVDADVTKYAAKVAGDDHSTFNGYVVYYHAA